MTVSYHGNHSIWLTRKRSARHISHVYEVVIDSFEKENPFKKTHQNLEGDWRNLLTAWLPVKKSLPVPLPVDPVGDSAMCVRATTPWRPVMCVTFNYTLAKSRCEVAFCAVLHFIRKCCPALIKLSLLQSLCLCWTTQLVLWWLFMSLLMLARQDIVLSE